MENLCANYVESSDTRRNQRPQRRCRRPLGAATACVAPMIAAASAWHAGAEAFVTQAYLSSLSGLVVQRTSKGMRTGERLCMSPDESTWTSSSSAGTVMTGPVEPEPSRLDGGDAGSKRDINLGKGIRGDFTILDQVMSPYGFLPRCWSAQLLITGCILECAVWLSDRGLSTYLCVSPTSS